MQHIVVKGIEISRFIVGGNSFSGNSHQSPEADMAMRRYFTTAKLKETLREAESLGVNTLLARADSHITRLLLEYWDEGGKLQWFAQTCPEIIGNPDTCVARAAFVGAKAVHIHGGVMDHLFAQGRTSEIPPVIDKIRQSGMLAGVGGHNPDVFKWAEDNLDVDYYMCSYYNTAHRDEKAEYISGMAEWFLEEDRRIMTDLIRTLSKPVIHFKVMAAGRNDPKEAFDYAARAMRPTDAVCVGIFQKDNPDMLKEDVRLLEEALSTPRP